MHEHLRHRLLGWWAGFVCDHPRAVLAVALLLAAASAALTATTLKFQPDRNALIDEDLDWNKRYLQYRENFSFDDLIVVVAVPEGPDGRMAAERYADQLGEKLTANPQLVQNVYWRIDTHQSSPASVRMMSWPRFESAVSQMTAAGPMLRAPNLGSVLAGIPVHMSAQESHMDLDAAVALIQQVRGLVRAVSAAIDGEDAEHIRHLLSTATGPQYAYLSTPDDRFLIMQVEPALSESDLEPVAPTVAFVREAMNEIAASISREPQLPGVEAGLTGVPVIEADETAVTQRDATIASIIAVVLISIIMITVFHSVHVPLLIVAALGVGVAWSFGFLSLSIGHLQLLSVTFTVILLGLGVDFGIHLISRYELIRERYPSGVPGFREAMIDTMQTVGPGVITGAVTTAIAFGTTLLTDFRGMAEMGLIAGVGILLCLISMLAVLPALMRLIRPRRRHVTPMDKRTVHLYQHHWWERFYRVPGLTVALVILFAFIAFFGARQLQYDYDLSNLLPSDVESVQWFERLVKGPDGEGLGGVESAIWFGASAVEAADPDAALAEARRRTEAVLALDSVAGVGGVGLLFPTDEQRKIARIREARAQVDELLAMPAAEARPSSPIELSAQLQVLGFAITAALRRDDVQDETQLAAAMDALRDDLTDAAERLSNLEESQVAARATTLNTAYVAWRGWLQQRIDQALTDRKLGVADLPMSAQRQAIGGENRDVLLLQVYPKGNVYNPVQLKAFVTDLRRIDEQLGVPESQRVTGTVVQIYESSSLMVRAYIKAGVYALIAVFLIVLIDFQRPSDALLCLLPVALAFVMLMGLMGANNLPINPANIVVLPLLFGIGVDCGVHILHRYRQAPNEHPPGLAAGTGKGVTITGVTTIVGFACLMIASHRGIASLGMTLALGMALTLLACLVVMPSVLELRSRWRMRRLRITDDDSHVDAA
jgi:hopanoid biosynthesis associated RND transporter like protein HpnN